MSKILCNLGFAAIMAVSASALMSTSASALSMSECSAKFKAAKASGTDAGMKWNDFRKAQCAADATPTAVVAPAVPAVKVAAPAAAVVAAPAAPGNFMKECSASWKAMKAGGTVPAGMKYKDFVAAKCVAPAAAAPAVAPTTKAVAPVAPAAPAATAPATKAVAPAAPSVPAAGQMVDKNGKPMSAGRAAMVTRERACGAKWKAMKAAGTVPAGQAWPQFWSACNKDMKAQGM